MTGTGSAVRVAIFGANSGIARAVARRYADRGASLVLVGRDAGALDDSARDLAVRGAAEVKALVADFTQAQTMTEIANRAWVVFGGIDIALICYGSLPNQVQAQKDNATVEQALVLNFVSPALLANALANHFEAVRTGTLAVVTSVAGERGRESNYIYGAAKGGLQRLLEGLRHRLFPACVAVLDIRPGFVSTRMTAHLAQGGLLWAKPEKVAADIITAIDKRRSVLYTPWFWWVIMGIVRSLPMPLFHRSKL
jgi:short-subunit dehydrogenase